MVMATEAEPEKWMQMKDCLYLQLVLECSPLGPCSNKPHRCSGVTYSGSIPSLFREAHRCSASKDKPKLWATHILCRECGILTVSHCHTCLTVIHVHAMVMDWGLGTFTVCSVCTFFEWALLHHDEGEYDTQQACMHSVTM